jgi:hypothetical protein
MARGDPAFPLEHIVPYMRGARFAVAAMRRRHGTHDRDLSDDAKRYVAMTERYQEAAKATFRLRNERASGPR